MSNAQQGLPHRLLKWRAATGVKRQRKLLELARKVLLQLLRCSLQHRVRGVLWPGVCAVQPSGQMALAFKPHARQALR